jgi:hypothetical protein
MHFMEPGETSEQNSRFQFRWQAIYRLLRSRFSRLVMDISTMQHHIPYGYFHPLLVGKRGQFSCSRLFLRDRSA